MTLESSSLKYKLLVFFVELKPMDSHLSSVENAFDLFLKPLLFRLRPVRVIRAWDLKDLVLIFLLKFFSLPFVSPYETPQLLSPSARS